MPSLFCFTTACFLAIIFATSIVRPATPMPWSAKWWPACSKFSEDWSSAFDGMQPTLVQVPPGAGPPFSFFHSSMQARSEEHTSELQSHSDLVCRLLLEKKNTTTPQCYKFYQEMLKLLFS